MSVFFCANIEGRNTVFFLPLCVLLQIIGINMHSRCLDVRSGLRILLFSKLLLLRRRENSKKRMKYVCFSENIYAAITVLLKCKFR